MSRKDSLIKTDSSDINPYILNEDTRYKLNKSHYVLGENKYRDLQNRNHERIARVKKLAEELGIEYTTPVLPNPDDVIKHLECMKVYHEHKDEYDEALNKVLEICTPEEVLAFIDQRRSPK